MIIIIGLFDKRAGNSLSLVIEQIIDNFIYINRHAQRQSHPPIIKRLASHIIADVRVAERGSGKTLKAGICLETLYLMGLNTVAVKGSGVKFHFLGQKVRYDSENIPFIVGRAFPVPIKSIQDNVLVGFPIAKNKRTATYRVPVECGLTHRKSCGI